jgi:hypothetical protein
MASSVLALINQYRLALARHDARWIKKIIEKYNRMYGNLLPKIEVLANEIAKGDYVVSQIYQLRRMNELKKAIELQMEGFVADFKRDISRMAQEGMKLGEVDAFQMLNILAGNRDIIRIPFDRIPVEVVQQMITFLDSKGELYKRLEYWGGTRADAIADAMVESIAMGNNPIKTARLIMEAAENEFGKGMTTALRTARTTQIWSYREATRVNYAANSDIVTGWIWCANLDELTCMSCVSKHGTRHDLSEPLDDHYNGRCYMVAEIDGKNPIEEEETGEDWFNSLDEDQQASMMGSGKYDAWKNGEFQFSELSKQVKDDVFGTMHVEASLKDLTSIPIENPSGGLGYSMHAQATSLTAQDAGMLDKVMAMDSQSAQSMLERAGYTKDEALQAIEEARTLVGTTPQTRGQYIDENGIYSAERQALHDKITMGFTQSGIPSENPELFLTGGLPGAGKSHVLNQEVYAGKLDNLVLVDSDKIKEILARADGIETLGALAQSYHAEADDIIQQIFTEASQNGLSVGLDATMKNATKTIELIDTFKGFGYTVESAFVDINLEEAMTRAIGRYLEGGRYVDPEYIASHDGKNSATAYAIKDLVDVWRFWDNNVPFGSPPILIEEVIH